MRVITWNLRRAKEGSEAWNILSELNPDIALIKPARYKTGAPQRFGTAVLVRGEIIEPIKLCSKLEWVNKELEFFEGNFVGCRARLDNSTEELNIISVYAPAWPADKQRLEGVNTDSVRSESNSDVWPIDILWTGLKDTVSNNQKWMVGGDFNTSETFDESWGSGNKEFLERMRGIPLLECLREYSGRIVPTFQNAQNKKIVHQIDHLFITENIFNKLEKCKTGDQYEIFEASISDHLPIIADFKGNVG